MSNNTPPYPQRPGPYGNDSGQPSPQQGVRPQQGTSANSPASSNGPYGPPSTPVPHSAPSSAPPGGPRSAPPAGPPSAPPPGAPQRNTPQGPPPSAPPPGQGPRSAPPSRLGAPMGAPSAPPPGAAPSSAPPGAEQGAARRKRSVLVPVLITALAAAAVFIPGGWLIGWLASDAGTMDSSAIASEVQRVLIDDYGLGEVQEVTCPEEVRPEQGTTFQCTFLWDGTEQAVPVTVGSGDGQLLVGTPEVED